MPHEYVDIEPKKERIFSMNEMMKVLYIQVGKKPQVIEIKHTLKEMQRLVGGIISAYSPFDDGSVIILNDTGKIDGLEFNRVIYDENGDIAKAVNRNTAKRNKKILTLDSMQSVSKKDIKNGLTYISVMQKNLETLKIGVK